MNKIPASNLPARHAPAKAKPRALQAHSDQSAGTYDIKLSEVISALSYALDITEGQPEGHAAKTCLLGMRIAQELGLVAEQRSALFYALLLKDLGRSSDAAKVCSLFSANDFMAKRKLYAVRGTAPAGSPSQPALSIVSLGLQGTQASQGLVQMCCERGAQIARLFEFPLATVEAIRTIDERWNGKGSPGRLKGQAIPLLGRIVGIAQTFEIFFSSYGLTAAYEMANSRKGKWFDPQLVDALRGMRNDTLFWGQLGEPDVRAYVAAVEPEDRVLMADGDRLDRIAEGFAQVIDAKSPWTFRHSEGVAEFAVGIAQTLGMAGVELRDIRRAALLHDIGKLGISNQILDKQGPLTAAERATMCRHVEYSERILERVACFHDLAKVAGAHHERLDGSGYHRRLTAEQLPLAPRILAVADISDAMLADRPYRPGMPLEQVLGILRREAGVSISAECVEAIELFLAQRFGAPNASQYLPQA